MADQDTSKEAPLIIRAKDVSGGLNTYIYPTEIRDNEVAELRNFEVSTPGLVKKVEGSTVFSESDSIDAVRGVVDFNPDTAASRVFLKASSNLIHSISSAGTSVLRATTSTSDAETSMLQAINKVYVSNGTDDPFVFDTSLSPSALASSVSMIPRHTTAEYFLNRIWANDVSNKAHVQYSNTLTDLFNGSTQVFKFGEGAGDSEIIALKGYRNRELLVFMNKRVEEIVVVDPGDDTTWERKVIDDRFGLGARDTIQEIGGIIYFMDNEYKIRALNRTALDAGQGAGATPISQNVDSEISGRINKTVASKASAGVFRDWYLISFPQDDATENSVTYAFDVKNGAWSGPWDVEAASKYLTSQIRANGSEELFTFGTDDSKVMRVFNSSYTASGASYSSVVITKKYDFNRPESDKTFGEIEVAVLGTGTGKITVEARVDQAEFQPITDQNGEFEIVSGAPSLPVVLPFDLGSTGVVRGKFQLEEFSRGRNIDFRITHEGQGDCQILEWVPTILDENYEDDS